mgnify:CR=1 FL=1
MKFVNGNSLELDNKYVLLFLKEHGSDEMLICLDRMLESFCRSSEHLLFNGTLKKDSFIDYIGALESNMERNMKQIEDKISKIGDDIEDKISNRISKLLISTESLLSDSISKFNISHISETLNNSIRSWLESLLISQQSSTIEDLEKLLVNYIQQSMITPLMSCNKQLLDGLSKIPMETNDKIMSSEMIKNLNCMNKIWSNDMNNVIQTVRNIDQSILDMVSKWSESKNLKQAHHDHLLGELKNIPMLTRGVLNEILRSLEQQSENVKTTIHHTQKQLVCIQNDVRDNVTELSCIRANMNTRLEHIERFTGKSQGKGKIGENRLLDVLSERLMSREGYQLENVAGLAHNCDIVVKRSNYPTIRIDSKAVGADTGAKVKTSDVEKFQRDLLELNNHGIMVSLFSGIIGIGNVEIQQLANGKFAVYLSNNNYDVDMIVDMIHLLYKLDVIVNSNDKSEMLMLTTETMMRVKAYMNDYTSKICSVKSHMKESINILNTIQFDLIEAALLSNDGQTDTDHNKLNLVCEKCNKSFKSKLGYRGHIKKCDIEMKS